MQFDHVLMTDTRKRMLEKWYVERSSRHFGVDCLPTILISINSRKSKPNPNHTKRSKGHPNSNKKANHEIFFSLVSSCPHFPDTLLFDILHRFCRNDFHRSN